MADVTIIGGANADIGGFPETAAVAEDSNPGKVRISAGGVGRNIAANAALMGLNTALVAAFGGDYNGEWLRKDCEHNGIDLSEAFVFPEENTSTYLYIADETGDMRLAINDMAITQRLTPEALQPKIEKLNRSSAVVLDANLPPRTIEWLGEQLAAHLIAD
ncbi:MAG: PfkB family carbohydrate kinase, partial [Clostridia bacterium]|nr:PfkB family carbohydrate kinase [Clostridia bacterium]